MKELTEARTMAHVVLSVEERRPMFEHMTIELKSR
jgi:hypothetical protein